MQIIRKVAVKQIVTDQTKNKLREEYEWKIFQLEQESQQLLFEQKKLEQRTSNKKTEIASKFKKKINSRKDHINWYKYKLEQLDILPIGSEIHDGEVDAIVEVEEGMDWDQMNQQTAIVIRDGKVDKIT
ncbi:YlqD family protein [Gracilibacillus sp. YIM 98692]|uniref:YlqD family protein n=1 Tax=Gracilibacillus sp. YIM 98692 TaxID=2663532 RepID=UPI0013CF4A65|nr:YlqD family protein [Gracilibacillus sp. YIM 98692]